MVIGALSVIWLLPLIGAILVAFLPPHFAKYMSVAVSLGALLVAAYVAALVAPDYHRYGNGDANWGGTFVLGPWLQYKTYGDAQILRQNYAAMQQLRFDCHGPRPASPCAHCLPPVEKSTSIAVPRLAIVRNRTR